jgi:hypothetical protein
MVVTAHAPTYDFPSRDHWEIQAASATGKINVGDYLLYSGNYVKAGSAYTPANKASGAGIALESNPQYDRWGNIVTASALKYGVAGVYRVSAESGAAAWTLGKPVWPSATGSGVAAPTGTTGVGALWDQAAKVAHGTAFSAGSAVSITHATGIAIVVGFTAKGDNSAELDILLMPPRPDYI